MATEKPPADVKPPELTVHWKDPNGNDWVPPMNGDVRGLTPPPPGTEPPKVPPKVQKFHVSPASLEAASRDIMIPAHWAINSYNNVKTYMDANKSWVFSVNHASVIDERRGTYEYLGQGDDGIPTSANLYEKEPDPHKDWTAEWSAGIDSVLLASADVIKLASDFLDALNNAGQFYVKSDKDSAMPELTPGTPKLGK